MIRLSQTIPLILILAAGASAQGSREASALISTKDSIESSVKLAPCDDRERREAVQDLFKEMGADRDEIVIGEFADSVRNVVVTKKGKTDEIVVVGAHFDKTDAGCGVIDNWTGITIIAHLYKTMRRTETEKTYVFVAFDKEERGLLGSTAMAKAIPKDKLSSYCAMVNFDSFGFTLPFSFSETSNKSLIKLAKSAAEASKLKFLDASVSNASADSVSFKRRGIPSITFSGIDSDWPKYLHTDRDQLINVNIESVYFGYRFGLVFLSKFESQKCSELR